uniref:V-set and immunoglobulin domain containing 10 n=1 Tax=Junco hyemalis TaxID=40217 RepID=A0A8C5JEP9_JUNHY
VPLFLILLCAGCFQSPQRSLNEVVFGQVGGNILLLCRNVSKEATEVVWFQGDPQSFPPLFSSRVSFPRDVRFSLVDNSSLSISELRVQDEGNYTCREVLNKTDHEHRVQLLVASKSSHSWASSPRPSTSPDSSGTGGKIIFRKCRWLYGAESFSHLLTSAKIVSDHVLSLLIDPPQAAPKCWAESSSSGQMLQLFCSWPGGYPHPTLHWREEGQDLENSSWVISSTSSSDTHVETLNSSHLAHRKVFTCVGSHVVKQEQPVCTVEIKLPSLESEPPQTCFVGDNVTLTCRVTESTPAARLSWLRDISQPQQEIQPGGRFLIAQEGNVSRLTIQNCSQATDGGCYVCKAQNPVGLRELFVCLTVKQPVNIVGVVGAVVVLSLLTVLTVTGVVLYYNPLLCLRGSAWFLLPGALFPTHLSPLHAGVSQGCLCHVCASAWGLPVTIWGKHRVARGCPVNKTSGTPSAVVITNLLNRERHNSLPGFFWEAVRELRGNNSYLNLCSGCACVECVMGIVYQRVIP